MLRTRHRARSSLAAGGDLLAGGELKLVVAPDGHLEPAEPRAAIDAPAQPKRAAEPESLSAEDAALIAANRRRISALHEQRYGGITSFGDLFASAGRPAIAAFGVAAVARVVIFGRALPLAAGLPLLVVCVGVFWITLRGETRQDRRQRASRAAEERRDGAPAGRRGGALGVLRPLSRMRRSLEAVTVDDTELEDELERLYEHGNKMDSGFWGVGR